MVLRAKIVHGDKRGHEINMYNGLNCALTDELAKLKRVATMRCDTEEERAIKKARIMKGVEDAMTAVTEKGCEIGLIRQPHS